MQYWLLKSEPDEFSIEDLKQKGVAPWDGVRNYQARNFMQQMQKGDLAFFYHSSCQHVGIAGTMKVNKTAYPDPLAVDKDSQYFDEKSLQQNKWVAIDMAFTLQFKDILSLKKIKTLAEKDPRLSDLTLIKKGSRLSVMPITQDQWQCLMENCDVG